MFLVHRVRITRFIVLLIKHMRMNIHKNKNSGFTLIELILYASLVSLLVLGISSFWSIIKEVNLKNKSISAVEEQGAFVADVISQKIREAGNVCSPLPGESGEILDLDSDCDSHTEERVRILLVSGRLFALQASLLSMLSDTRVYIPSITFSNTTDLSGGPANVNYTVTLQSKNYSANSEYSYSKTFSGGGTIRVDEGGGTGGGGTGTGGTGGGSGPGFALDFNGTDGYVSIPDSGSLAFTTAITASAWVNVQGGDGTYRYVMTKSTVGANTFELLVGDCGAGEVVFVAAHTISSRCTHHISSDEWHLLTGTYDGSSIKLYIDGVLVDTSLASGGLDVVNDDTLIGMQDEFGGPDSFFNGYIDEPLLFNRALSAGEITALYNSGVGVHGHIANSPFTSGFVAGYHFDENTGTTVNDFSGNSNTGTLHGGVTWTTGIVPTE